MATPFEKETKAALADAEPANATLPAAAMADEKAPLPPTVKPPIKEGGVRGWMQVMGAFFMFFNIWGFTFCFGSFQEFYQLAYLLDSTASSISWIGTIQAFLLLSLGVGAGPLFDLGFYKSMIFVGGGLATFGVMMLSLSRNYYQILLSQGICMGVGFGFVYIPSLALVSRSFVRKRALALGVATSGAPMGGIVYTIVFEQLQPQIGFPWTVRVMGFLMLATFTTAAFLLLWKTTNTGNIAIGQTRRLFDRKALTDIPFWSYTIANFFMFLGYMIPFYYMPTFAQTKLGASWSMSLNSLIISQASSIIGRVATTTFAHHYGSMIPWITAGLISGLLCLTWISIHDMTRFLVFSAFYGGFSGGLIPLPPSVFPHVCPDPSVIGTWLGMAQAIGSIASLVGAPIGGALGSIGSHGDQLNFTNIQLFAGLVMMSGGAQLGGLWFLLYKMRDKKGLF